MKVVRTYQLCLFGGILYGLSWPIFEGLNLSFLAWFAFVPLFVFLDANKHHLWRSILGAYLAMVVFGTFSAGWLFHFPDRTWRIAVIFFAEEIWFAMPFLPFFFLQRRLGFDRALWLFPLLWMLWEWVYLGLEFTMGTHLSPYSQSGNLWLIQFVDLTGMWGLSFWLMLFNVLVFKALKQFDFDWRSRVLHVRLAMVSLAMLAFPLAYSAWAYLHYSRQPGQPLTVSLIPTQYGTDFFEKPENQVRLVEETLHRSDSLAFHLAETGRHSDLYLWPETGVNYTLTYANLGPLLMEAVGDWESALITGCKGVPDDRTPADRRHFVSGVLLSSRDSIARFHHKTVLTPGQEMIPYHATLAGLPGFPIPETDVRYVKKGGHAEPLPLLTRTGQTVRVGVSLCFEQWYPDYWTRVVLNGAEVMVHLAGEGWYGQVGFQAFMANVTRMRCMETRRDAARCANVGLSGLIDRLGRMYGQPAKGTLELSTASVFPSTSLTVYTRYPGWFPVLGLITFLVLLTIGFRRPEQSEFTHTT